MPTGVREAADGVVVFDCVKVNVFGARQPRRLAVYPRKKQFSSNLLHDPTEDELHILDANGYIKRRIKSRDLVKVEPVTELSTQEDNETALNIYFRELGKTSTNKRRVIFKDKEAKNYFKDKIVTLNPALKGDTVAQAATGRHSIAVEGTMTAAASTTLGLGSFEKKRGDNNEVYTVWPIKVESRYGFVLNYCAEIHDNKGQVIFKDDSVSGRGDFVLNIKTIRRIDIHCINEKALRLLVSRSIEKNISTETVIYSDSRQGLIEKLLDVYFKYLQYPDAQKQEIRDMMINSKWFEALPTAHWLVFEVTRTTPGNRGPRILLLNPEEALLHVMFAEGPAPLFAAGDDPEQSIVMKKIRVNVERSVLSDCGLQIRIHPSEEESASPEEDYGLSFEFKNHGERERFCAYLNQVRWPEAIISTAIPSDCSAAWDITRKCMHGARKINSTDNSVDQHTLDELNDISASQFDVSKMWSQDYPRASRGIFVGTYNVDCNGPPDDVRQLRMWIPRPHFNDDLAYQESPAIESTSSIPNNIEVYVIGLQEIGQQKNRDAWLTTIQEHLNIPPPNMYKRRRVATVPTGSSRSLGTRGDADAYLGSKSAGSSNYVLLNSQFMWQIGLLVFVRPECLPEISNVNSAYEATGVSLAKNVTGKQLGNKGGVGISFRWRGATMAFINCHLNARLERVRQRENDYRQILSGLGLDTVAPTPKTKPHEGHNCDVLSQHDFVWVLGDLNYRTTIPFEAASQLHEKGQWAKLRQYDQLLQERSQRRVLHGFDESPINFPPTYRWKPNAAEFSNKRSQAPSYTDRVLVKALPGIASSIKNCYYGAAQEVYGSDHRPVSSVYTIDLPFPYIGVPRPAIQTRLTPPTFFSATDTSFKHLPYLVFKEVKITKFHGISAPPSMSLAFHGSWLPEIFEAPTSAAISASGITQEQFSALDDLRQEIKYDKRKSSKSKKSRAESGSSSRSQSSSLPKAGDRGDSLDEESDEEDIDDENSDLAAHVFTDFNCFSISGDVDSLPNMDPSRRRLLKLEARYFFGNDLPVLKSSQWDPRWLRQSHLVIIAQGITPPRKKPLAAGWAVLPLREVCDLCSEAAAGDYSGNSAASAENLEDDGVPSYMKGDPCPFQVDLVLGAQPVATLSGFCAFRSEINMDFDCQRFPSSTAEPIVLNPEPATQKRPPPPPPRPPPLEEDTHRSSDSEPEHIAPSVEFQMPHYGPAAQEDDAESEYRVSTNLRRFTTNVKSVSKASGVEQQESIGTRAAESVHAHTSEQNAVPRHEERIEASGPTSASHGPVETESDSYGAMMNIDRHNESFKTSPDKLSEIEGEKEAIRPHSEGNQSETTQEVATMDDSRSIRNCSMEAGRENLSQAFSNIVNPSDNAPYSGHERSATLLSHGSSRDDIKRSELSVDDMVEILGPVPIQLTQRLSLQKDRDVS